MKRQHYAIFILLSALLFIISACGQSRNHKDSEYNQTAYSPKYAERFVISTCADDSGSVLIESIDPWQGADSVTKRLLVLDENSQVPDGFDGPVLKGKARRIVAMSSSHVAMLDALGAADCIVGVSGLDFISSPSIQKRRQDIADIGFEGNIDYERLIALEPDLVTLYATNSRSAMEPKLRELGIPYIYICEYLENDPLGRAEWIKVIGHISGKVSEADSIISKTAENYIRLKNMIADKSTDRPEVMLNTPYRDSWFMPSLNNYIVRIIEDAGGRYVYRANTSNSSVPIDIEDAYLLTDNATFWLNTGQYKTISELTAAMPRFGDVGPVVNGQVYNNNARTNSGGGNDFFERGAIEPDVILNDLINIFHPGLLPDSTLRYYRRLQ